MDITFFLAKVFGLYMSVIGITILLRRKSFITNMNAILNDRPTLYFSAIMTLIMGILLILAHNIWVWGWPVVVTIFCWLVFIKGVVRVVFPEFDDMWKGVYDKKATAMTAGIFTLVVGVYLLVMGFCT